MTIDAMKKLLDMREIAFEGAEIRNGLQKDLMKKMQDAADMHVAKIGALLNICADYLGDDNSTHESACRNASKARSVLLQLLVIYKDGVQL